MLVGLLLAACSEGVKFVQESDTGGVVVYPYKGNNAVLSSFRGEALDLIVKKCPRGYAVLKEGETKALRRIQDSPAGAEEVTVNRWAIKFSCK